MNCYSERGQGGMSDRLGGRIQEREVLVSERGSQGGMSFGEGELDEEREP